MRSRFPLCPSLAVRQRWEPKVITAVKCTLPRQPSLWQLEKQPPRHGGSYCAAKTTNTGWLREEGEVQRENIQRIGKSSLSTDDKQNHWPRLCAAVKITAWQQNTFFFTQQLGCYCQDYCSYKSYYQSWSSCTHQLKQSETVHIIPITPLEVGREMNPGTYPSVHPSNPETPTLGRHTYLIIH